MIRRQRIDNSRTNRTGHTLVELTIAMSLATLLMLGLSSALLISTRAFDGHRGAQVRSEAAEVQANMLTDLQQATGFTTKTATSVTFTVPDRDGDTDEETITYDWDSGNGTLDYIYNGSPPETLLNDVTTFDLSYLTRSLTGSVTTPPPLDPNTWGARWVNPFSIFGYDTNFADTHKQQKAQHATQATLSEAGTVNRIVAYIQVTQATQIAYAIYDDDGSDEPDNLIVASGTANVSVSGWHGIDITPTSLAAGQYWLTLAYDNKFARHHIDATTGLRETKSNNPFGGGGWSSTWSNPSTSYTGKISIYAEYTPD